MLAYQIFESLMAIVMCICSIKQDSMVEASINFTI